MSERTFAQRQFDLAKLGWVAANKDMLAAKIEYLHEIALYLIPEDPRQALLRTMMARLERLEAACKTGNRS
jgi:hypothetical protein